MCIRDSVPKTLGCQCKGLHYPNDLMCEHTDQWQMRLLMARKLARYSRHWKRRYLFLPTDLNLGCEQLYYRNTWGLFVCAHRSWLLTDWLFFFALLMVPFHVVWLNLSVINLRCWLWFVIVDYRGNNPCLNFVKFPSTECLIMPYNSYRVDLMGAAKPVSYTHLTLPTTPYV